MYPRLWAVILGFGDFAKSCIHFELKLLLDFVPNHVGLDHEWVRNRPDLLMEVSASTRRDISAGNRARTHLVGSWQRSLFRGLDRHGATGHTQGPDAPCAHRCTPGNCREVWRRPLWYGRCSYSTTSSRGIGANARLERHPRRWNFGRERLPALNRNIRISCS